MADGEGEPEFGEERELSESHKFVLYKDLESYHSLWDASFVPSKQAGKKAQGLEELSQKYNFSPSYLKRQWVSYSENFAGTEIKTKMTARSRSATSSKC